MDKPFLIKCPHCAGTNLASNDTIPATCDVTSFELVDGQLVPEYCGESELNWDGQAPDPINPWICMDCGAELTDAERCRTACGEAR